MISSLLPLVIDIFCVHRLAESKVSHCSSHYDSPWRNARQSTIDLFVPVDKNPLVKRVFFWGGGWGSVKGGIHI